MTHGCRVCFRDAHSVRHESDVHRGGSAGRHPQQCAGGEAQHAHQDHRRYVSPQANAILILYTHTDVSYFPFFFFLNVSALKIASSRASHSEAVRIGAPAAAGGTRCGVDEDDCCVYPECLSRNGKR